MPEQKLIWDDSFESQLKKAKQRKEELKWALDVSRARFKQVQHPRWVEYVDGYKVDLHKLMRKFRRTTFLSYHRIAR